MSQGLGREIHHRAKAKKSKAGTWLDFIGQHPAKSFSRIVACLFSFSMIAVHFKWMSKDFGQLGAQQITGGGVSVEQGQIFPVRPVKAAGIAGKSDKPARFLLFFTSQLQTNRLGSWACVAFGVSRFRKIPSKFSNVRPCFLREAGPFCVHRQRQHDRFFIGRVYRVLQSDSIFKIRRS
ncbi:MAG: hypothetical protein LBN96_06185 [Desulfovibrio sp.]|jgi:hypothetical protein|nr:hypothetical protein [Desulfovibrio sp.]